MTVGGTLGLVLGSSVLAAALGAYLQSGRQREERFRERMIESALEFLEQTAAAEKSLLSVENARGRGEDGDADTEETLDAIDKAWGTVPRLRIVFRDQQVASAAEELIAVIDDWRRKLNDAGDRELPSEEQEHLHQNVGEKKDAYTGVTQQSIRRRAF